MTQDPLWCTISEQDVHRAGLKKNKNVFLVKAAISLIENILHDNMDTL